MFSFDPRELPTVQTRRMLLAIDLQNDFMSPKGSMHVAQPDALIDSVIKLAGSFRRSGDIVCWVNSRRDANRDPQTELLPHSRQSVLDHHSDNSSTDSFNNGHAKFVEASVPSIDIFPEAGADAFLSGRVAEPGTLKATGRRISGTTTSNRDIHSATLSTSWGCAPHPRVLEAAHANPSDIWITKTHYSAFKATDLLQRLRRNFATELFVCGSLLNAGVYATAIDASQYGYSIVVVEPCCGYRKRSRRDIALTRLIQVTGCEVVNQASFDTLTALPLTSPSPPTPTKQSEPRPPVNSDSIQPQPALVQQRPITPPPLNSDTSTSPSCPGLSGPLKLLFLDDEEQVDGIGRPTATADGLCSACAPTADLSLKLMPVTDNCPEPAPDTDQAHSTESKATGCLCEGDTTIILDALPEPLASESFDQLRDEVSWLRMSHQGGEVPRLVAVQGDVAPDGSMPLYRHPSDSSPPLLPFSPAVVALKNHVERHLGHALNHVLIQYYRDGNDYISEHSDKTLDIVPGSFIANLSLGTERTMVFRTKRPGKFLSQQGRSNPDSSTTADASPPDPNLPPAAESEVEARRAVRARLPHNSVCRMGLLTNMRWLHTIRQDKRSDRDKSTDEIGEPFAGGRISLTFRRIGTFLNAEQTLIWGQGATAKLLADARPVLNGQSPEAVRMLHAFGTENHASNFDWDSTYGAGFDVLHLAVSPRFFAGPDPLLNMRVAVMLADLGISYARGTTGRLLSPRTGSDAPVDDLEVRFCDTDPARSVVHGDVAIMLYLDAVYAKRDRPLLARELSCFQLGLGLFSRWRAQLETGARATVPSAAVTAALVALDKHAVEADFLAGPVPTLADYAVWPALHAIVAGAGRDQALGAFRALREYYDRFAARDAVALALRLDHAQDVAPKAGPG